MKKIFLALVALCSLYGCQTAAENKPEPPAPKKYVKIINQDEFKALIADYTTAEWKFLGDKPAIVDFSAVWCGPCKTIAPHLEKLAEKYDGQIVIYNIDVDDEPEPARAYKVKEIPAVMFIPTGAGKSYKVKTGSRSLAEFDQLIQTLLLNK